MKLVFRISYITGFLAWTSGDHANASLMTSFFPPKINVRLLLTFTDSLTLRLGFRINVRLFVIMKKRFLDTKTSIFLVYVLTSFVHCALEDSLWLSVDKVCVKLPGIKVDNSSENDAIPLIRPKSMITCSSPKKTIHNVNAAANLRMMSNSKFTLGQRKAIVDLHNEYRAMVQPPAADMNFMEWHEEAAILAQTYAEHCVFEHGFPPNHPLSDKLGQNLYKGPDKTGQRAVMLWFEEWKDFNIHTLYCAAEMCGHYTQVAWAKSKFVGCGVTTCSKNQHLIVCHYFPAGNYIGEAPYRIGYPCSNCADIQNGAMCSNNTCVSQNQCDRLKLTNCGCNLHCHNCGRLDESKCRCECLPGWDQLDCSVPCMNAHQKCGKSPGFPSQQMCWTDNMIKSSYCRKMCHQCKPIGQENDPSKLCCAGIICDVGQVLNQYCQCVPKCSGNVCSGGTSKGEIHSPCGILLGLHSILTFLLTIFYR